MSERTPQTLPSDPAAICRRGDGQEKVLCLRLMFILPLAPCCFWWWWRGARDCGGSDPAFDREGAGRRIKAGSVSINRSGMLVLDNVTVRARCRRAGGELGSVRGSRRTWSGQHGCVRSRCNRPA